RGECAQFCRHGYRLLDAAGKALTDTRHLLSLCDLDLSGHLQALLAAGIGSLKIEGRLKDAAYVKNTTAYYRLAIDKLLEKDSEWRRASSGCCRFDFMPDPEKTFHRGATDYFLTNRNNRPAAVNTVKSIGEKLGTVRAVRGRTVSVNTEKTVANGDGLCFFDREQHLIGCRVNRAENDTLHLAAAVPGLETGMLLYRNHDSAFLRQLARSQMPRRLGVKAEVWQDGETLHCRLHDGDGLVSAVTLTTEATTTHKPGKTSDTAARVRQQMGKTGGTIFALGEITARVDENFHYAAATINELRRQALAAHRQLRLSVHPRPERRQVVEGLVWPDDTPPPFCLATNDKARQFLRRHGLPLLATDDPSLPLMICRYCIKNQLGWCQKQAVKSRMKSSGNMPVEPLCLEDNTGRWRLEFDCEKCEMRVWNE
ncbi:MAG TPA: hypothetical protein DEB25_02125, partial [Desulfobulbaceae bacterium]|nr:hypothetical protein [Desulfobulbaceae bacterium]